MIKFFEGFVLGGLAVLFFWFIVISLLNLAFGEDTIIEHDYILTYKYRTPYGVEFEHDITVYFEVPTVGKSEICAANNRRLNVSLKEIAKYIKAYPKYAHTFDGALQVIEDTWCHDNNN